MVIAKKWPSTERGHKTRPLERFGSSRQSLNRETCVLRRSSGFLLGQRTSATGQRKWRRPAGAACRREGRVSLLVAQTARVRARSCAASASWIGMGCSSVLRIPTGESRRCRSRTRDDEPWPSRGRCGPRRKPRCSASWARRRGPARSGGWPACFILPSRSDGDDGNTGARARLEVFGYDPPLPSPTSTSRDPQGRCSHHNQEETLRSSYKCSAYA